MTKQCILRQSDMPNVIVYYFGKKRFYKKKIAWFAKMLGYLVR